MAKLSPGLHLLVLSTWRQRHDAFVILEKPDGLGRNAARNVHFDVHVSA